MLVTERGGRLRVIHKGVLTPQAISGVPEVHAVGLAGLMDVAFIRGSRRTSWSNLTYSKPEKMASGWHWPEDG